MKKTLIAILVMAGMSSASAATTFLDLTQGTTADGITYEVSGDTGTFTGSISELGGGSLPHAALSFVLDITNLESVSADTLLVNFNLQNDVSLYATTSGLRFGWAGGVWSSSSTLAYSDLLNNTSVFEDGDSKYITLTMTLANISGEYGGTQLYSESGKLIGHTGLGSAYNTTLTDISVNTSYIESATITTGWVDNTAAPAAAVALTKDFKASLVPEPATASLSLLGLAALMIRRRRA